VASPSVADGTVYVPSFDRMFYALSSTDGKVKWQLDISSGKLVTPTPVPAK
jgi:outer membrane protein assembly factor BamB